MKKKLISSIVLSFVVTACLSPITYSATEITNSSEPTIITSSSEIVPYAVGDIVVNGYKFNIYSDYVGPGCANTYNAVMGAQILLNGEGYSIAKDGLFGNETYNAIMDYQTAHGLSCDGIIGPITWKSLLGI